MARGLAIAAAAIDFIQITAAGISQQSDKEDVQIDPPSLPTFLCGSFWAAAVSSQSSATATTFVRLLSSFCKHADQMGKMAVLIPYPAAAENLCFCNDIMLGSKKGQIHISKCGLWASRLLIRQHK